MYHDIITDIMMIYDDIKGDKNNKNSSNMVNNMDDLLLVNQQ